LLQFSVHQLEEARRHYLLLPKLNGKQMRILSDRLEGTGFVVQQSSPITAKSRQGSIHIRSSGVCWASFDPADTILPAIPEVLSCPKESLPRSELESTYFQSGRLRGGTVIRLVNRIESSSIWDRLRSSGDCGLTPDERLVASFLIRASGQRCEVVTDFPVEGSTSLRRGTRTYFSSELEPPGAESTLREIGTRAPRNSYLPRDGVLRFGRMFSLPHGMVGDLFRELGEWCYFSPSQ
jgi:hypothetical protein